MIFTGDRVATNDEKMDEVTSSQDEQKSSYSKRSSVVELWRKREGAISSSNTTHKNKNTSPNTSPSKSTIISAAEEEEEEEEKSPINSNKFEEEKKQYNHQQHQHQQIDSSQHSEQDSRQHNEKSASDSNLRYDDDDDDDNNSKKNIASDSERNEPESAVTTGNNGNNNTGDGGNGRIGKKKGVVAVSAPARRSNIRDSWKKKAVSSPKYPSTPNRKAIHINTTPCSPVILYDEQPTESAPSNCCSPVVVVIDDVDRQSLDSSLNNSSPIVVESITATTTTTTTTTSPSVKRSGIRNSSWRNRGGSIGSLNSTTLTTNSVEPMIDEQQAAKDDDVNETPPSNSNNNATSSPSSSAFDELKSKWAKFGVQQQPSHPTSTKSLPSQATTTTTPTKSFPRTVPPSDGNHVVTNQLTIQNELVIVTGEVSSPTSNISSAENNKSKFSKPTKISRVKNLRKINTSSSIPGNRIQKSSIGLDSKVTTKSSPSSSPSPLASNMGSSRLASRRKLDSKGLRSKYTRRQTSATSSTTSNTDEESLDITTKNSSATNSSADDLIPIKQSSIAVTTSFVSAEQFVHHSLLPSSAEKEFVPSFPLDESLQDDSLNLYNTAAATTTTTTTTEVIGKSEELNTIDHPSHSFVPIQSQYETTDRRSAGTNGGEMTMSTLLSPQSNSTDALNNFIAVSKFKSNSPIIYPKTQNNQQQNPNNNEVDRTSCDDSWSSSASNSRGEGSGEIRNQNYTNNSRSPFNSRASRKLREIRQRQQQLRNSRIEGQDNTSGESSKELNTEVLTNESQNNNVVSSPELTMKASVPHDEANHSLDDSCQSYNVLQPQPLLDSPIQTPRIVDSRPSVSTPIIQRTKTNESCASSLISMDESTAVSPSLYSETTNDNSQMMHSKAESATIGGETRDSQTTRDSSQRSRLIVPDADRMVPEEFVSEKDANVESFKTAYETTSFEQIAKDMTEQASSVLGINILNNGMQNTLNELGLGDVFRQKKTTRKKVPRSRVPSPVEEVAIEVEYVADSD
ncbi:hypothetical protein FRACYDRAFT_237061 [Fragilariopsis cylindrus CCMP1102]|uniref:Uncharacterized protein n=1 Tax=Fragilariopsis cylindrus CCMP1102 TaxID=635003 RepID=A0A1E7FKT8_9STRA|nr:hypothetical protein FRACYDRAFT_237061 [Fragilariopsis cylindrus CCMP1102]|eukprot:OEU18781.1 hypothetical protein FRACYDRAFT_237061 [Fragilariopsis cylindrus CCMP1102]